jgi:hypothetical protein
MLMSNSVVESAMPSRVTYWPVVEGAVAVPSPAVVADRK